MEDPRDTLFGGTAPGSAQDSGVYVQTDEETFRMAAPPAWRAKRKVSAKSRNPDAPLAHLLADAQWHLGLQEHYQRSVRKLQTQRAVQECSRVEVPFDPTHETLTIHQVKIWRGKESIDAGGRDRFRLLQREANLEDHIYDGMLSAVLILQDVRVNDIIDFSFTIRENDAGYREKFSVDQTLEWPFTMQQFYLSLHVPKGRRLRMRYHKEKLHPEIEKHEDGSRVFTWSKTDSPPIMEEPNVPVWYWPHQRVQVTEFASWKELADWTRNKWMARDTASEAMDAEVARIESEYESLEERAQAAVRFVQDDIRYLAVGVGVGSFVPSAPASVMHRRIGDCKDKSLLLSRMLEPLGIWARPALVNTVSQQQVGRSLPALGAFDHAIVVCELEGRRLWIDPTVAYERGALVSRANPPFGRGLIIDEETDDLAEIDESDDRAGELEIWEKFIIEDDPVRLESRSVWRGTEADRMRFNYHSFGRKVMEQRFEEYYQSLYPGLIGLGDFVLDDDEAQNAITLTASYEIENFSQPGKDKRWEAYVFVADSVKSRLVGSNQRSRNAPFAVLHPVKVKQHIEVEGTMQGLRGDRFDSTTGAYAFSIRQAPSRSGIRLDFEYVSKRDHVLPSEYEQFVEEISKVANSLTYVLELPRHRKRKNKRRPPERNPGSADASTKQSQRVLRSETESETGDALEMPEGTAEAVGFDASVSDKEKDKKMTRAQEMWEQAREGAPEPMTMPETGGSHTRSKRHRKKFQTDATRVLKMILWLVGIVIAGLLLFIWIYGGRDRAEVRTGRERETASRKEDAKIGRERAFYTAREAFFNGDYKKALRLVKGLEERYPDNAERLYLQAFIEFRMDGFDRADELVDRSVARDPTNANAFILRGFIARARGEGERAVEAFLEAAKHSPDNSEIYRQLGVSLDSIGKPDEALEAMETARELRPDHLETIVPLALLYEKLGKHPKVEEVIEKAIRTVPESGPVWLFYAEYLLRKNDLKDAAWAGKKAIDYGSENPEAYASVGRIHLVRKEIPEAERLFAKGLTIAPENARLLYGHGICLMQSENYTDAIIRFEKILERVPREPRSLNNIGAAYIKLERHAEAEPYLVKALEIDPDNEQAKANLKLVRARKKGGVPVPSSAIPPASTRSLDDGWLPKAPPDDSTEGR